MFEYTDISIFVFNVLDAPSECTPHIISSFDAYLGCRSTALQISQAAMSTLIVEDHLEASLSLENLELL